MAAVFDFATARTSDTALFGRFFHALLQRGVYLSPAQFDETVRAAADALANLGS